MRISVDLPAPLGPSRPRMPGPASRSKSLRPQVLPPYNLLSRSITNFKLPPKLGLCIMFHRDVNRNSGAACKNKLASRARAVIYVRSPVVSTSTARDRVRKLGRIADATGGSLHGADIPTA